MPVYADKKTGRLFIEFRYKGVRFKERMPDGMTKKEAERIEIKAKADLMFDSHGIAERSQMTFDRFVADVYNITASTFSKPRWDRLVYILRVVKPFLYGKPLRLIKASDIERIKAARLATPTQHGTPRKPQTVEREMAILSNIFTSAMKNDLIDYNPCSRVSKLPFDNIQDKILKREDEEKFFANMHSEWARDICMMVLHTGLRQNDLMTLTRFQVRFDENCIVLIQGKVKRRVMVMLNAESKAILEKRWHNSGDLLFASPVTGKETGSVRHAMQRACKRAGIPPLTIRDLRRTFGTRLIENGTDAVTTARMLGHSDLRMLPRYTRSVELMQEAADKAALKAVG